MPFVIMPCTVADEWTNLNPIAIVDLDHFENLKSKVPMIREIHDREPNLAEVAIWNQMAVWYDFYPDEYEFCDNLDDNRAVIVDELPAEIRDLAPAFSISDYPHQMSVDLKKVVFCGRDPGEVSFRCNVKGTAIEIATSCIDLGKLDDIPRFSLKEEVEDA